jgi:hypothetical protein
LLNSIRAIFRPSLPFFFSLFFLRQPASPNSIALISLGFPPHFSAQTNFKQVNSIQLTLVPPSPPISHQPGQPSIIPPPSFPHPPVRPHSIRPSHPAWGYIIYAVAIAHCCGSSSSALLPPIHASPTTTTASICLWNTAITSSTSADTSVTPG